MICKNYIYYGEYKNDRKHGWGILKYNDGSSYYGEFKSGLRDGFGHYTEKNSNIMLIGEFKKNKKIEI